MRLALGIAFQLVSVLTSYPKRPTRAQGVPSMKEIEKVMAKKMFSSEMYE
jgi:hypothetical protein